MDRRPSLPNSSNWPLRIFFQKRVPLAIIFLVLPEDSIDKFEKSVIDPSFGSSQVDSLTVRSSLNSLILLKIFSILIFYFSILYKKIYK